MIRLDDFRDAELGLQRFIDSANSDYNNSLVENVTKTDVDIAKAAGKNIAGIETGIDIKMRILKWTLFFPVTYIKRLVKLKAKRRRIEKILSREEDPERRAELKDELKDLTSRQVRIVANMSYAKEKAKKKAEKAKGVDKEAAARATQKFKREMEKLEKS